MLRAARLLRAVDVVDFANARLLTLNREKALNSLNIPMVEALHQALITTPHPQPQAIVVLKGAGSKAFCAGGDVVSVVKNTPPGTSQAFFFKEYTVNHHLATASRPQVSLWNGIVMGGGVGMSIHGKYRVATEQALFAMPETAIGLFPDVGGSWFLPRLPNQAVGLFLALTGRRLKGSDLQHAGLATHFVPTAKLAELESQLCHIGAGTAVADVLSAFAVPTHDLPPFTLEKDLPLINDVFTPTKSIEEMMAALRSATSPLGPSLADGMLKCSPTALKVSLELFRRGAALQDPADVFAMEYVATQAAMRHGDFASGVTALLIDKTNNATWKPNTIEAVTGDLVATFFTPDAATPKWSPNVSYEEAVAAVKQGAVKQ